MANFDQDIDLHIGRRLRARRRLLGLSQPELATAVGVKFQQIQKYECGEDRISASRLWLLCDALNASVDYFYEGLAARDEHSTRAAAWPEERAAQEDARVLAHSYERLADQSRRALLELARSLSVKPQAE